MCTKYVVSSLIQVLHALPHTSLLVKYMYVLTCVFAIVNVYTI